MNNDNLVVDLGKLAVVGLAGCFISGLMYGRVLMQCKERIETQSATILALTNTLEKVLVSDYKSLSDQLDIIEDKVDLARGSLDRIEYKYKNS